MVERLGRERDFYLDLLSYHRSPRRLVGIELKLGSFDASCKGQMELYMKWLDRCKRRPGEEPPIGLILCGERNREQIELPLREMLEAKLYGAMWLARGLVEGAQKTVRIYD